MPLPHLDFGNGATSDVAPDQNGAKSKEPTTVSTTASTTKKPESTTKKRKTDFRNVCWGDSVAKVKKEEKEELITEDDHLLMYSATVDHEDMYLFYYFDSHDKLYMAQYGSQKEHTSFGQWKKDYDNLKRSLTAKYGKPNISTVINNVDQDLIDAAMHWSMGM